MHEWEGTRIGRRAMGLSAFLALAIGLSACRWAPDRHTDGDTLTTSDGVKYLAHEVIVRAGVGVSQDALRAAVAQVGGSIAADDGGMHALGYFRVELPQDTTADDAISALSGTAEVAKAERNILVQLFATPSDPLYSQLWGMAKINAPAAWDTNTGSSDILVAVSDTGMDYTHPDLTANVWTNPGEIPGNGKDDDGNGYIDDVHGWDFANNDSDPMDDHGHGTHVSGTIGAAANNGVGVAGINWHVKIQAVKFLSASGGGSTWAGAQTLLYAATMKARVVNASWGCLGPSCYASYLEDAIRTLSNAGGIFVVAAGNNANNNDAYPAYPANYAVDNVIAVAATDSNDQLASFSNYGATRVHLAAPGVGILSSLPGGQYASWSGTSMATPHVAGAAALFLSARPDATVAEVKQKLMDTTDAVPALAGKTVSGGRLNLAKLIAAAGHPPAAPSGFDGTAGDRSDVTVSWNANTESDLAGYRVRWGTASGFYTQTLDLTANQTSAHITDLTHGTTYYFVVYARNATGLVSAPSKEKVLRAQDRIAPPQVVDLAASALPGVVAQGEVADASGEFSSYWAASNAFDGDPTSAWISPGRAEADQEFLTVRLYTPYLIDAVDLTPNVAYPQFFPIDFDVEVSSDGDTWAAVGGQRNAAVGPTDKVRVAFPPTLAAAVRLRVVRAYVHPSGLAYASIAEMAIQEASSAPDTLRVTFTAPGDDPGVGRAQSYDLRRATAPVTDANFAAATAIPTTAPLSAGAPESIDVAGLAGQTTYYFGIKATDEAGNVSPLSNIATAATLIVPPSTITDLIAQGAVAGTSPGTITLAWTAPGADGKTGQASSYDLRQSTVPLTAGGFDAAAPITGVPAPAVAGTRETFAVTGLDRGQVYYFALRAVDEKGAVGGVSNIVVAMPPDGVDVTPPARVADLAVALSNPGVKVTARIDSVSDQLSSQRAPTNLTDGDVATAWVSQAASPTTPAWVIFDYGTAQPLNRFRTNPSTLDLVGSYPQDFEIQTSVDKLVWTPLVHVEGLIGTFAEWNEWTAPVTYARYVRLYITRRGPAAGSAVYAAMGEFEAYAMAPSIDADLTWVAPGDDGYAGTAARYDLRQSTVPIDDTSFASATQLSSLPPLHGGMIEVHHLAALPAETKLYFAIKAFDSDGNAGPLSNVATLTTPGVAPAPVADLAVSGATKTSLSLSFTATGDDGVVGRATAYELRYAKAPIAAATWASAAIAPTLAPQNLGTRETVTVAGLDPTSVYYFAIKVIDDVGNTSPMSNLASGSTLDGTAPARVTDLVAATVDPTQRPALALTVTDSSGSYSAETAAINLLDANAATVWISPGTATVQPMSVTFDLGGARKLGRLRLRAGVGYADLFPPDFKLETQATAGGAWKTVVAETGITTAGDWEEWLLGAVPAVAARLTVTKTVPWNGKLYTALGDVELYEDPTDYSTLRLSWTAPGDDGTTGTAKQYDVRRAPQAIDSAGYAMATPIAGSPSPHPAGYLERFDVTGLPAETSTCFALTAIDKGGNVSPVSNSSCATTPGMPPSTITDLAVTGATATTATLTFTAPGADGTTGTASSYELRRSTARITSANWSAATLIGGLPAPHASGTAETVTATGLSGATLYHFAIRAIDAGGNAGAFSNDARGTTADNVPPASVTDLSAATVSAQGGSLALSWTAPGDSGLAGTAQRYDVRISTAPITTGNFASATPVAVGAPQAPGTHETATVSGLPSESLIYVALETIDAAGNISPLSNVASARTRDEAPAAITDLAVIGGSGRAAQQATMVLQWTAPGDDASVGTATSYDIRYSASAINAANFTAATPSAPGLTPSPAGTQEHYTVTGLAVGVRYWFAIKTSDERGNVSAISVVASSSTPDEMPPSATADLAAATGTAAGTLVVSLTAPGDDGAHGTAQAYDLRWSLTPLDANSFASAATLSTPAPAPAGTHQTFTVSGLPNETPIHLMLRTRDDAGNFSTVSNDASASTPQVPPAAITDLRQLARGTGSVTVGWTAPGDDGNSGTAVEYDLRYATVPLTAATFATGTRATTPPPSGAGAAQSATVSGLLANKTYYLAIETRDDRGNWSSISNVLGFVSDDTLAPGTIGDLAAATRPAAGSVVLRWTATGDDGTSGTATSYDLRRSSSPISAANWNAATPIAGPAPHAAGSAESFTVTGLAGETTFHFAIRAIDEAGNTGPVSNDSAAATPPVAPAAISDLAATLSIAGTSAGATLRWTATGDDGTTGTATRYDLRYATSPITAANFSAATPISVAAPQPAGTTESAIVNGLQQQTTYYFAIEAIDDTSTPSPISNVATIVVPDLTKPSAPASFSVTRPDTAGKRLTIVTATASSTLGPSWQAANAIDGDAASSWSSAGGAQDDPQSLTFDLGAASSIEQVQLTPDARYPALFPNDFTLAVSADNNNWKTVATEQGFVPTTGDTLVWGFPAESARYLRLAATATGVSFGKHYAIVADAAIFSAAATDGRAQLTWIAPGDDGTSGTATRYQVFQSTRAFTEADLGGVALVPGAPTPVLAGLLQTMLVTGLAGETTYDWAVRAVDEAGNIGPLSAVLPARTNDVAPAPVRTLAGHALGATDIQLDWQATGGDANVGTAASYEIRYLPGTLTSHNFASATLVPGLPAPISAGSAQSITVSGLTAGATYHFGLIAKDAAGNASYLSNIAVVETQRLPDTTPPAAIQDLSVALPSPGGQLVAARAVTRSSEQSTSFGAGALIDGDHSSFWASAAASASQEEWARVEYPASTSAGRIEIWPADALVALFPPDFTVRVSPDGLAWTTVATQTGYVASAGMPLVVDFAATSLRYVELHATRLSAASAGVFYLAVAEIELYTASAPAGSVVASWTSPTDDGPSGAAATYDLRAAACPLDPTTAPSLTAPTPSPAGSPERARLSQLPSGMTCFAIRSTDAAGNASDWSNIASINVP